ncbi:branched-chain-amino-acid aminotransferase-like protein 2 [Asterias rubens]|uniref:branched-chain-amino-acid aminotransferase-like protein 2 n=1 Tax=Asterias rubens TaxID=7604 RepID=UPI001454E5CE|nr:branched-chain-amino-acid aminotransferase-like protein 2 [Asterias rubens]XP_033634566.1 branched-chain-amino-acid aminotransferase-like protein 2 [Asterias rubens]
MANESNQTTRVMLWSCPRSLSTAFTRAILELGNVEVFNEEFAAAYFFGPERIQDRNSPKLAPNHSFKWVKERLEADYPGKVGVFGKDFAYPILPRLELLPQGFYHTFLVRDPTKVFASLKPRFEASRISRAVSGTDLRHCIPVEGYTYKELRELYEHVKGQGLPTLVLDADDLLDKPVEMMRYYCQTTGLPFKESMVTWKPANCRDLNWHCCRALRFMNWLMQWYEGALKSSGFKKPSARHIDVESLQPDVKLAIEVSQPHYDFMYSQRVQLDANGEVAPNN